MESLMFVHWAVRGERIWVHDRVAYPRCKRPECDQPVTVISGSSMRLHGLGQGWTDYLCRADHVYRRDYDRKIQPWERKDRV